MNGRSFRAGSVFNVDNEKYYAPFCYDFFPARQDPIPKLPSLSELTRILDFDTQEHLEIWKFAAYRPSANVKLPVRASYNAGGSAQIEFEIDTGAFASTLDENSADALNIDRQQRNCEELQPSEGIGGQVVVGLRRWISIELAGVWQEVPVLVPPESFALQEPTKDKQPVCLVPNGNLLGRAQILENYLLCLDAARLYAFRDIFSVRRPYTSRALSKFRNR